MATTDSKAETLTNDDRTKLAQRAAWEIDALAKVIIERVNADVGEVDLSVRGMAVRIRELSGAVMVAITFDDCAENLRNVVDGVHP